MALDLLLAALGLVILLLAGDALVRGAVNMSLRIGIPAMIVSLTIVAFGTSAPELLISVSAILDGAPGSIGYLAPYSIVIVPSTRLARTADKAETIRSIIGLNGITIAPRFSFLQ